MINFCRVMGVIFLGLGLFMLMGSSGVSEYTTFSDAQFFAQAVIGIGIAGSGILLTRVGKN